MYICSESKSSSSAVLKIIKSNKDYKDCKECKTKMSLPNILNVIFIHSFTFTVLGGGGNLRERYQKLKHLK